MYRYTCRAVGCLADFFRTQFFAFVLVCCLSIGSFAQTTGKLTGLVTDNSGQPLIAANVVIDGTELGASTDLDGYFVVLNIRSGTYTVRVYYVGYQTKVYEKVRISADQTTRLDVTLAEEAVEGREVVVTAEKPLVEFNVTNAVANVNKEELEQLPIQNLTEIVNLQAGVVDGHFRGGRLGEVQYQVEGVSVNNPYDNSSILELDRSVIEEVQVISGTFDAKYGQAMSGVVNTVLRSGSERFEWSGELYGGDFYTSDETRYPNNQDINPVAIQNAQLTLSGPAMLPQTTFLLSGRRFANEGYLFGERRFMPTDSNDFQQPAFFPSGDNATVAMNDSREHSGQFKLTNRSINNVQLSYQAILNDLERQSYNHGFRLNPEGIKTQNTFSLSHGLDWTHTLSQKVFYKIGLRQNYFKYTDYKYENYTDPRYIAAGSPQSFANYEDGAIVEGVDLGRFEQETSSYIFKSDFTWQLNKLNLVESGFEYQQSEMSFGSPGYIRFITVNGEQILQPIAQLLPDFPGILTYEPIQMAGYLQDRVEWRDIVVRGGLRLEYFDAKSTIPSDLRNPANAISAAPQSVPVETSVKIALAPRLGLSFPLSSSASLYASYGHFYQMPGLSNLYNNADYSVLEDLQIGGINYGVRGNPDLKPEKTVQYEFGLKQALTNYLGLELTLFYKDIRDLLGVEFITTYNVAEYARFTNIDYGSVYGFTVALDQRAIGPVSTTIDYTLQMARGNSSDPAETANRAQANKDSRPRDIAFNWDQRHTLNATAIYAKPNNYSISAILKIGSGQPYTPAIGAGFNADLETNTGRKDSFALLDLRAEKFFTFGFARASLFLRTFNLLNEHFVNGFVFSETGSPDYSQFPARDRSTLNNPGRFYAPRRIEFGISLSGK